MNQSPPELFSQRPIRSDFGRSPSYRTRRIITIAVCLAVVGGVAFHYVGGSVMAPGVIPTIKAENGPFKQKPQQPGGIDIPHQDVEVYQELDGKDPAKSQVEHLLPPPETPSPTASAAPPAVTSPPTAAPPQTENIAPAKIETITETPPAPAAAPIPAVTAAEPQPASPPLSPVSQPAKPVVSPPPSAPASTTAKKPVTMAQVSKDVAKAAKTDRIVQLASVQGEGAADVMRGKLQTRYASILGDAQLRLVKAYLGDKGIFYRIQSQPLSGAQADKICKAVKRLNAGCILVR